ncbi:MAG: hypothetical protein KDD62_07200 [Bdellovibrionales bacterium]|nr:hypothetical protein [Bdellovibrionales bacterium]
MDTNQRQDSLQHERAESAVEQATTIAALTNPLVSRGVKKTRQGLEDESARQDVPDMHELAEQREALHQDGMEPPVLRATRRRHGRNQGSAGSLSVSPKLGAVSSAEDVEPIGASVDVEPQSPFYTVEVEEHEGQSQLSDVAIHTDGAGRQQAQVEVIRELSKEFKESKAGNLTLAS